MDPPQHPDSESFPFAYGSFTGTIETRVCGRDACRRLYGSCSEEEKTKWKRLSNSRNTNGDAIRWFCGGCVEHYCNKPTTRRQGTLISNDLINVSCLTILSDQTISYQDESNTIEADVAAAQRGRGRRKVVQAVGPLITRHSPSPSAVKSMYSASPHVVCANRFQVLAQMLVHVGARMIPLWCGLRLWPVTVARARGTRKIMHNSMSRTQFGPAKHLQLGM